MWIYKLHANSMLQLQHAVPITHSCCVFEETTRWQSFQP